MDTIDITGTVTTLVLISTVKPVNPADYVKACIEGVDVYLRGRKVAHDAFKLAESTDDHDGLGSSLKIKPGSKPASVKAQLTTQILALALTAALDDPEVANLKDEHEVVLNSIVLEHDVAVSF